MSVITHNMLAQFGNRQLKITTGKKAKSAEKLSSGYRINRSADDAAGLQISEKMRAQIRGLKKASTNASDAISMIQVGEGALGEVHSVLQRINELAVQAANDTNGETDREAIQEEIDQLVLEIDRTSESTEFNKIKVLRVPQLVEITGGKYGEVSLDYDLGIKTETGALKVVKGVCMDFANTTQDNIKELIGKSFTTTCTQSCDQIFTFKFTDATSSTATISGSDLTVEIGINNPDLHSGKDVVNEIMEKVKSIQNTTPFDTYSKVEGDVYIGHANGIAANDTQLTLYSVNPIYPYDPGMGLLHAGDMMREENALHFQIGANSGQHMEYTIRTINSEILDLEKLEVSDYDKSQDVIERVQNAIAEVSTYRSYMGAMQNRLEHVVANNDNVAENTQAAESRLRDTDMAAEMVKQSKESILAQVGESVLAQANQSTQGILTLLQQ